MLRFVFALLLLFQVATVTGLRAEDPMPGCLPCDPQPDGGGFR